MDLNTLYYYTSIGVYHNILVYDQNAKEDELTNVLLELMIQEFKNVYPDLAPPYEFIVSLDKYEIGDLFKRDDVKFTFSAHLNKEETISDFYRKLGGSFVSGDSNLVLLKSTYNDKTMLGCY